MTNDLRDFDPRNLVIAGIPEEAIENAVRHHRNQCTCFTCMNAGINGGKQLSGGVVVTEAARVVNGEEAAIKERDLRIVALEEQVRSQRDIIAEERRRSMLHETVAGELRGDVAELEAKLANRNALIESLEKGARPGALLDLLDSDTKARDLSLDHLKSVLFRAYEQVSGGKGKRRHGRGKPLEEQPWRRISEMLKDGEIGCAWQLVKKAQEASHITDHDRFEREVLGVIVYGAFWLMLRESRPEQTP